MVESNNAINNIVGASISGVTNTFTITNPSNTASSVARESITVGGASAGDPSLNFNVSGVTDFEMGIDNNDSDKLKISQGTALGTNDTWIMTTSGERTMPLQPAFAAQVTASNLNVTGDNTIHDITDAYTEFFDQGSDFAAASGTFTAPITGRYLIQGDVKIENVGAAHTSGAVFFKINAAYREVFATNPANVRNNFNFVYLSGTHVVSLTAADTVLLAIQVSNGAKTVGLNSNTFFSIVLLV
jgi:hypothetical protein